MSEHVFVMICLHRMHKLRISTSDFNLNKFFILLQLGWLFEVNVSFLLVND